MSTTSLLHTGQPRASQAEVAATPATPPVSREHALGVGLARMSATITPERAALARSTGNAHHGEGVIRMNQGFGTTSVGIPVISAVTVAAAVPVATGDHRRHAAAVGLAANEPEITGATSPGRRS